MKIKDVFEDIIVGYNLNNSAVKDEYAKLYKTLQKSQYEQILLQNGI